MFSPEVQVCEFAGCPTHSPKDGELHHLMPTVAKIALELHIPCQSLLVGENEVQWSTSLKKLLYNLENKVFTSAVQETPRLFMHCFDVPPADSGVIDVHNQN